MPGSPPYSLRIAAIAIIWFLGTGMLAVAIPLVSITHSDLIPVAILVAVTLSTFGVWRSQGTSPVIRSSRLLDLPEAPEMFLDSDTLQALEAQDWHQRLQKLDRGE